MKKMENQYCKVGAVTPITNGSKAIAILEYQYQNFMEKASDMKYADAALREFFEQKAIKIGKILDKLVS